MLRIINLAGIPPFPGFWLKLMIINELVSWGGITLGVIFAVISGLNFFGYIKFCLGMIPLKRRTYMESLHSIYNEKGIYALFALRGLLCVLI